jgi:hypothetical protein
MQFHDGEKLFEILLTGQTKRDRVSNIFEVYVSFHKSYVYDTLIRSHYTLSTFRALTYNKQSGQLT